MNELFGFAAKFDVVDACFKLEDTFDEVHDLAKTPLCFCMKGFLALVFPNCIDQPHVSLFVHYPFTHLSNILMSPLIFL